MCRDIGQQVGAGGRADLLADVTAHALRRLRADATLSGTYHCVAGGETSWHGYARHVIEWARSHGLPVKVSADAVRAVPATAFPLPAPRPLNSRLDTHKLRTAFDLNLPHWQGGVERMLTEVNLR